MLENIVFEKDYAEEAAQQREDPPDIYDEIFDYAVKDGFLKTLTSAMKAMPKVVVAEDKAAYEDLLARLDTLAQMYGGQIKGVVDYERWESRITVILPFFEISTDEEHELLADIAEKAHYFNISATEDGNVRLTVMINYFEELGDKESLIEETIEQDEKLVELLQRLCEAEMREFLADPEIRALIEERAAELGITPEELLDMLGNMDV